MEVRIKRGWLLVFVLLVSMSLVGVASAQQGDGDPERGGELYVENCAVCHGQDGQGRIGATLQAFSGIDVDAALTEAITQGIDGTVMPAWSENEGGPLSEQDIEDIVAYIQSSFQGTEPIQPAPTYQPPDIEPLPDISGEPSQGAVVYQANCVMCHGPEGRGRFGAPLAKSWPGNQPAVYVHEVVSDGIEGTTMPAWSQEQGGPLSGEDIDNVTAYVLSFEPSQPSATETATVSEGPLSATTTAVGAAVLLILIIGGLVVYYRRA